MSKEFPASLDDIRSRQATLSCHGQTALMVASPELKVTVVVACLESANEAVPLTTIQPLATVQE